MAIFMSARAVSEYTQKLTGGVGSILLPLVSSRRPPDHHVRPQRRMVTCRGAARPRTSWSKSPTRSQPRAARTRPARGRCDGQSRTGRAWPSDEGTKVVSESPTCAVQTRGGDRSHRHPILTAHAGHFIFTWCAYWLLKCARSRAVWRVVSDRAFRTPKKKKKSKGATKPPSHATACRSNNTHVPAPKEI